MSGWKFKYQLRDNSLGYTGRTTMDNDRPLSERVARLEAALAQLTARHERGATEPTDPPGTQCGEPSPYTGDKCQEIKGHIGSHHAGLRDKWERTPSQPVPYRMAEPENVGAVVVSKGFRLVRIWEVGHNWADLRTGKQYRWVNITDPQPYQNCVLTADDPEPPLGSVVLDVPAGSVVPNDKGIVWRRDESGWRTAELSQSYTWAWVTYSAHPVTLLYRGEA